MSKGAVNLLMIVIIIVIVFLLLIVFTSRSASYFDGFTDEKLCSLSFVETPGDIDLSKKCPTNLIKITQDSITRNNQEVTLQDQGVVGSRDVEKVIAEELATCWSRLGNGKIQLDPPSEGVCFICSDIGIKDLGEQSYNLRQFLRENEIKPDQTYEEYLTEDINVEDFHYDLNHLNQIELRNNENYFIVNGNFFDKDTQRQSHFVHKDTQTSELIYSQDLFYKCGVLE